MTIIVETQTKEEEEELITFLQTKKLNFNTINDVVLTEEQQSEILRRDRDFLAGLSSAQNWEDVKAEITSVYR